jgi:gamma-butyrobetaine dioxygenase
MTRYSVELGDRGLTLRNIQGVENRDRSVPLYANYLWLRDNCSTSWDIEIGDRQFDIVEQPLNLRARSAQVQQNELVIVWEHDGHQSRYDIEWLARWLTRPGHDDLAHVPVNLWKSDFRESMCRFEYSSIAGDPEARIAYLRALLTDGMALVEGVADSDDGVKHVAEIAGHVRATFSGYFFDVKAYPKPVGTAYTARALEPHTDVPCEQYPPGIQYLHCRVNDVVGGQTTFVDGAAVAHDLKTLHPLDFELLSTISVPFRFAHDAMDMRARQTVIVLDDFGEVQGVTISQHMADIFDIDQHALDDYYPAFCRFGAMLRDRKYQLEFRLEAGQCIVFDNQRIVHGRSAYDPNSGARLLRGCYSDRGELRSRYRVALRSLPNSREKVGNI